MAKCFRCGNPPVICQRYSAKHYCPKCFVELTRKRIYATIRRQKLVSRNDKIAVGYSGGKDSGLALTIMHELSLKMPLELFALSIDEGSKNYRHKALKTAKKYASELGIPHHIYTFKQLYGYTIDQIAKMGLPKKPCTYCGVLRRKALNTVAKAHKAGKLVIAHNLDDEAQSILINTLRGDIERSSRLGFKNDPVYPGFVQRIKPLRAIPERESLAYCLLKKIPFYDSGTCPYSSLAFRQDIKFLLNDLEWKYPGTKHSIVSSFDKTLPAMKKLFHRPGLNKCKKCGDPTSASLCKACEYLESMS